MHRPLPALRRKQRFQERPGKAGVWLFLFDFAVYGLTFCMSLSVCNKRSLAGQLPRLLLPSILAGTVLGHVLLVSGSCAPRNTRWHLGTVPSHPCWPVLVLFQSFSRAFPELWECWWHRGERRSFPIEAVVLGS